MRFLLRTIGRPDPVFREAADRYLIRLRPFAQVEWVILPESRLPPPRRQVEESQRLLEGIDVETAILLDGRGEEWSSEELAERLAGWVTEARPRVFLVGGPFGVDDECRARVACRWSLSRLTFPHEMVPMIVLEQLYRAFKIMHGQPYHH